MFRDSLTTEIDTLVCGRTSPIIQWNIVASEVFEGDANTLKILSLFY